MVHVYEDKALTKAVEEEEAKETQNGCGVCNGCGGFCGWIDRNRVIGILIFAFIGGAIGIGLSYWEPEDPDAKVATIKWLGLVGDMFIRSLKCFVLPLVFVNVIVSIVDMSSVGKAGSIAWYVIIVYLLCTVIAACFGVIGTLIFKNKYEIEEFEAPGPAYIQLGCNEPGYLLAEGADGSVSCIANYTSDDPSVNFIINDISKTFVTATKGPVQISFSDSVYSGIFAKSITDNIILSFSEGNFVAVIIFAIVFGIALSRVVIKAKGGGSFLLHVLKELDVCLQMILFWIIFLTPFAVCSLIAAAIGKQSDLGSMFRNIGYHIAASFFGWTCQFVFVYYGLFYLVTKPKLNIFWYHKQMIPAQTMAFASASSAATIPTSLACIKSTGVVPDAIAGFCIPLGATVNMDGGAVYFVTACVWLAHLNGITVTAANYFLLVICATLGAIGTAPVPSASLVLIITAYNTVFNTTGIPDGFGYILAIDWFMDRCRTVLNVTGDLVVSAATAINRPIEDDIKAFDEEESPGTLEKDVGSDGSPSNSNVVETVPEKSLNAE